MNDRDAHAYAAFPREQIVFACAAVPINQAGVGFCRMTPYLGLPPGKPLLGQLWQVENIQVFCTAVTATSSVRAMIETPFTNPAVGLIVPVAGAVVQATLVAPSLRRMPMGSNIVFTLSTDGTGTITNLVMTVTVRPFPMSGDA